MNKIVSVREIVYGRLKSLKLCEEESFNSVIERKLNDTTEAQSTLYAVIDCKITGEECYNSAHCESCEIAEYGDGFLNRLSSGSGDE